MNTANKTSTPETRAAIVAARIAKTAALDAARHAIIVNRGHGLPNVGDTVLLEGELDDAIFIRKILSAESPKPSGNGALWQRAITVEGEILRGVAVEHCVSEYVATAILI